MVKIKKIIYLLFTLLLVVPLVSAQAASPLWSTEVTTLCPNGLCLEGNGATWQLKITNVGDVPFTIQQIAIEDSEGFTFAHVDLTSSQTALNPGQVGTVNIDGVIPPPTRGSTLFYKINYIVGNSVFPENTFRRMIVMPLSEVECQSHNACSDDELCYNFRCTPRADFNQSVLKGLDLPNNSEVEISDVIQISLLVLILVAVVFAVFSKKKKK